ncbi:MAG: Osmosensitive K+ channel histidine kinase KdpD [uncultured Thermomicrobiales bacterium]|uniref:histidine kinase n=1 Tax=uncultured Thermomicrobiales bacterium TaxID=1645740 RepID=A0A6J4UHM8_9BACT|nr:MAG: Osmosensitive K+ channel histidine kinase KdpD [uncultured Thermomicrobiales bacterium]
MLGPVAAPALTPDPRSPRSANTATAGRRADGWARDSAGRATASCPPGPPAAARRRGVVLEERTVWDARDAVRGRGVRPYLVAALVVGAATLAMLPVRNALGVLNVLLVYLLLTIAVALTAGERPAPVAAVLGFLAFDVFFSPPYLTVTIAAPDHVLALSVYLGIAIGTGRLVGRVRVRTEVAERGQRRTAILYEPNAALVGGVTLDAILVTIAARLVDVYGATRCRILLPGGDTGLAVRAAYPVAGDHLAAGDHPAPVDAPPDRQALPMATWAMEHRRPAGRRTAGRRVRLPHGTAPAAKPPLPTTLLPHPGPDVLYVPITTAERTIGVLEVTGRPGGGRFGEEDERLLGTFAAQAALALERARLTEEAARAAILAQSDDLKSALLAAVSHDPRTPLAAIKASATSLLDRGVAWREEERTEFLRAVDEETDRLTSMVDNLLDLSRIEGGALRPDRVWYDAAELVDGVAGRFSSRAGAREVSVRVAEGLPLVWPDDVEIAPVLTDLLENALAYTPAGAPITIAARPAACAVGLAVSDRGWGIPP